MVVSWSSINFCVTCLAFWIQMTQSISTLNRRSFFFDQSNAENDLTDLIYTKSYYPKEKSLPKNTIVKDTGKTFDNPSLPHHSFEIRTLPQIADDDLTYLISKLSDDELMKLLNSQPKKTEYDLNDIAKIVYNSQSKLDNKFQSEVNQIKLDSKPYNNYNKADNEKENPLGAFFKLDHKAIDPDTAGSNNDHNYKALQKLNDFLYNYPQTLKVDQSTEDIEKKEQLFEVLVSQLKTLCCKKSKPAKPQSRYHLIAKEPETVVSNEYLFLIINDEIKSNFSDELISVDPDSLSMNSSVLLLGPITSPLSDGQLKFVVSRIAGELSKPEYLPLLHQLADGTLSDQNLKIMKSLVTGPETRRYIKPHRCNHQSKLAKVYGGPKWIVCTGYLNLNGPSIYD